MTSYHEVYLDIDDESTRAIEKFGEDSIARLNENGQMASVYLILAEEVGEVAMELNEMRHRYKATGETQNTDHLREELIQVASVASRWAEALS